MNLMKGSVFFLFFLRSSCLHSRQSINTRSSPISAAAGCRAGYRGSPDAGSRGRAENHAIGEMQNASSAIGARRRTNERSFSSSSRDFHGVKRSPPTNRSLSARTNRFHCEKSQLASRERHVYQWRVKISRDSYRGKRARTKDDELLSCAQENTGDKMK